MKKKGLCDDAKERRAETQNLLYCRLCEDILQSENHSVSFEEFVEKNIGDKVTGATINTSGYIEIKATGIGEESTLSSIIRLVEEASASKAPVARAADKISGVFVPVVICIAVLAAFVWFILGKDLEFSLSIGIAVLVI